MKKSSSDLTMGNVAKQLLMFVKKGEDAYEETSLYLHCNHYSGSCVHSGADWYQCLSENITEKELCRQPKERDLRFERASVILLDMACSAGLIMKRNGDMVISF